MSLSSKLYNLQEGVRIAVESIVGNKVRAGLTILGVAVGVFVVVVISAAVHGINTSVAKDFESTGPTTFFVSRYPISFEACDGTGDTCTWLRNPPITWGEVERLSQLEDAAAVGVRMDWSGAFKYRDQLLPAAPIEAYTANWAQFGAPDMLPGGRIFTEQEFRSAARVIVLNTTMAERLFGDSDPLDKVITVNGNQFTVIGVYKETASFLAGGDRAKGVMPVTTLQRALNVRRSDMGLVVKPRTGVERDVMVDQVTATLRGMRGLRPSEESNFAILTQDKLLETYDSIFGMFFLVMIALSAVGLIVGGVGVVAIMMISVTERTREIGVRKALGATRLTILWQFLIEAVTLTGIGAVAGLVMGWLVAFLIRSGTSIEASIPPGAVIAALVASAVTGIMFGMIPAARAAKLDPVEALRHE
ncbi:ABC transporter permease [Pseudogemmatithrix spongiicola]|uniref:ABC transporter permease n=1 Tax=Pseudogemmatithrix spongiicola TaxID=3062599 RepID=A0AA49JTE3_9BACT|nr:ABC transporter permease [Gemmatimonadaceae bacterium 'strain 138']WKW14587.1 ABC transporter permease [Gemmatimonadaceae bacterium 'strain 318']